MARDANDRKGVAGVATANVDQVQSAAMEREAAPYDFKHGNGSTLLIACGALAREIVQLIEINAWRHLDVTCLPAKLHHRPALSPEAVRQKIQAARGRYQEILVVYGDCGTSGALDAVLAEEGVKRIPGPHCFSFLEGNRAFEERADEDFAAFFLSDFFCRHFETIVWKSLGLDRREDMAAFVFANYQKIVFIPQTHDPALEAKAREIAKLLKLDYEYRFCGYGDLESFMGDTAKTARTA